MGMHETVFFEVRKRRGFCNVLPEFKTETELYMDRAERESKKRMDALKEPPPFRRELELA